MNNTSALLTNTTLALPSLVLPVTLTTAAACATLQLALSALVISRRAHTGISLLDGGDTLLTRRMRAHANLTETAPICLLLLALLELAAAPRALLLATAGLLIVGRLLHASGLVRHGDNWARRAGMVATLLALSALGAAGLWTGLRGW
jgi:uncharacterized protein